MVLPHGTGKSKRVLVFAKGEKVKEAEAAGADFVGSDEIVQKIQGGWLDFDVAVATPDMMGTVGRLGKILGPRGLMPNPKLGTVTMDLTKAISEIKAGKVEYRTDKAGNVHCPIGKASFDAEKLQQNFQALIDTLIRVKPAAAKGQYIRSITVSATMGRAYRSSSKDQRDSGLHNRISKAVDSRFDILSSNDDYVACRGRSHLTSKM